MLCVIIESPFKNDDQFIHKENILYAEKCMFDSLNRGESPFLSHLLYTKVLDDNDPEQRKQGIIAASSWIKKADLMAVYTDRGITEGMKEGIKIAENNGIPIEYRRILI